MDKLFYLFIMNSKKRCSFSTIPNAFKQCTISLLITHSALFEGLKEKLPDCSDIYLQELNKGKC